MQSITDTIFISIASYRDPELVPTIKDCIANAKYPNRLVFGICWQKDETESLGELVNDFRINVIEVPYKKAKGACWARSLIQELYNGETYYLQLDSHHRFSKNWDVTLIKMLDRLKARGYKKPLLTAYLPEFFPDKYPNGRANQCLSLEFDRYLPEGPIFIKPHTIDNWKELKDPLPARFLSGHFIFTLGQWAREVKYDPYYYFHGEEPSLAARSFTHGYDLFHPNKVVIWHEYTRSDKVKQWDDDLEWTKKNSTSYSRYRYLHGMGSVLEGSLTDIEKYGFGNVRTLEEYERYVGVKFSTRQVHKHTAEYKYLPVPQENFEENLLTKIRVCIDVWKELIKELDYDHFAVALLDENGADLYREDATAEEIYKMIESDPRDQFIHIWREYMGDIQPTFWRVWPHSTTKGWCDRIENKIIYE